MVHVVHNKDPLKSILELHTPDPWAPPILGLGSRDSCFIASFGLRRRAFILVSIHGSFSKLGVPFLKVLIIRIKAFWGLYWGCPI